MADYGVSTTSALLWLAVIACGRTVDDPAPPVRDASPPPLGMRVYAGGSWSCSLDARGAVACWGLFALGSGSPPAERFTDLAVGGSAACGVGAGGTLRCWPDAHPFAPELLPTDRFASLSMGAGHGCGIRTEDRQVVCWGDSQFGATDAPHGRFIDVAAGSYMSCALRESGQATCWGLNEGGQATPPEGTFVRISAGFGHACALDADGVVWCWGGKTGAHGQRAWCPTAARASSGPTKPSPAST